MSLNRNEIGQLIKNSRTNKHAKGVYLWFIHLETS